MTATKTPDSRQDAERFRQYLLAELEAAALYRRLADVEPATERGAILRELAHMEDAHAHRWRVKLESLGEELPGWQPSRRSAVLGWLARRFGTKTVLPILEWFETGGANAYAKEEGAQDMAEQEAMHGRLFAQMRSTHRGREPLTMTEREGRHRGAGGGSIRAAVFGVNDGLVSNLSLIMGVAGADPGPQVLLLAGLAGLLAGAFSMATGEYVSVRTQAELLQRELDLERAELEENPQEEMEELALIYRAKGLGVEEARNVATKLISNQATALDTLAREELGLDPSQLGSPWVAAGSSFVAFAIGALIPLSPYLVTTDPTALFASAVLSGFALASVGGSTALLTGRPIAFGAFRMLALGALAAGVTFLVGKALGVAVSG
ncbi:MAG: rubrerythrin family protein [Dehalococcoidia bacterium]|nr:rubrerythrin family protein [Dehalococcoidia bacterium]